ncbi:MAG: bifunctional demethylmenaquinone methyltransferase/2-methoxy-6-polyprenyl-1,4-benzoquinol methylase UbiE [Deltaproteobacteria bacterium]|nr:bifunctional demethylmenaquinone methyltransferase/2-methoxy-6-polyprenyl-1,4-benzoquinol methylase UbiE [Myxococcales bacterium]MDP3217179.1 bifunctional demethylmenaquinone methyltransferase/2-methoxy-6-polyprenyl-1,4-benzoquinol methylase UbiE [Deltaproteobacteria bacterium]
MGEVKTLAVDPRGGSGEMFDRIASRYDLMNRIISLGIDQRWRRRTVDALALKPGARVLDLATGTGDLAMMIARRHPEVTVVGVDPSAGMLAEGDRKVAAAGLGDRVTLRRGDAEQLEADDASVDGISMAFGIRNVVDRPKALREMARALKPGGRVAILELSEPRRGLLGMMARVHIHHVVPTLGALLSGAWEYRYLQRSIAAFPPAAEFAEVMRASGLRVERAEPMTFGVVHLYVGVRDPAA